MEDWSMRAEGVHTHYRHTASIGCKSDLKGAQWLKIDQDRPRSAMTLNSDFI
jgi:hypothetical protein